ncbi:hypothetical protein [Ferruginibacter sp.]
MTNGVNIATFISPQRKEEKEFTLSISAKISVAPFLPGGCSSFHQKYFSKQQPGYHYSKLSIKNPTAPV